MSLVSCKIINIRDKLIFYLKSGKNGNSEISNSADPDKAALNGGRVGRWCWVTFSAGASDYDRTTVVPY